MKKILILLVAGTALLNLNTAKAQSFHSGAFILGGDVGIDGNTANRNFINNEQPNAQTLNGTAPASTYDILAEVGIFRWLGIGAIARFDNYFEENNTLTETSPKAGAFDLGGQLNIHILTFEHFDLLVGGTYGFSHITYNVNNGDATSSASNGSWGDIHATGRLYFGKIVGVNLTVFMPMTSYSNFKASNEDFGDYVVNYWKSSGYGASIGVQFRIL